MSVASERLGGGDADDLFVDGNAGDNNNNNNNNNSHNHSINTSNIPSSPTTASMLLSPTAAKALAADFQDAKPAGVEINMQSRSIDLKMQNIFHDIIISEVDEVKEREKMVASIKQCLLSQHDIYLEETDTLDAAFFSELAILQERAIEVVSGERVTAKDLLTTFKKLIQDTKDCYTVNLTARKASHQRFATAVTDAKKNGMELGMEMLTTATKMNSQRMKKFFKDTLDSVRRAAKVEISNSLLAQHQAYEKDHESLKEKLQLTVDKMKNEMEKVTAEAVAKQRTMQLKLKAQSLEANGENLKLQETLKEYKKKNGQLQTKIQELEKQMAAFKNSGEQIENLTADLQLANERIQTEIQKRVSEVETLKQQQQKELFSKNMLIDKYEKDAERTTRELKELNEQVATSKNIITAKEKQIGDLYFRIDELNKSLDKIPGLQAEIKSLKEQLTTEKDERKKEKEESTKIQTQLTTSLQETEKKLAHETDKAIKLREAWDLTRQQKQEAEALAKKIKEEFDAAVIAHEAAMEKLRTTSEKEIARLNEIIDDCKEKLEANRKQIARLETELTSTKEQLTLVTDDRDQLKERVAQLETELSDVQMREKALIESLQKTRTVLEKTEMQLESSKLQHEQTVIQLEYSRKETREAQGRLEQLEMESESKILQLEQKVKTLTAELAAVPTVGPKGVKGTQTDPVNITMDPNAATVSLAGGSPSNGSNGNGSGGIGTISEEEEAMMMENDDDALSEMIEVAKQKRKGKRVRYACQECQTEEDFVEKAAKFAALEALIRDKCDEIERSNLERGRLEEKLRVANDQVERLKSSGSLDAKGVKDLISKLNLEHEHVMEIKLGEQKREHETAMDEIKTEFGEKLTQADSEWRGKCLVLVQRLTALEEAMKKPRKEDIRIIANLESKVKAANATVQSLLTVVEEQRDQLTQYMKLVDSCSVTIPANLRQTSRPSTSLPAVRSASAEPESAMMTATSPFRASPRLKKPKNNLKTDSTTSTTVSMNDSSKKMVRNGAPLAASFQNIQSSFVDKTERIKAWD